MPIYPGKVRHADISEGSAPKIPGEKNELVSYITACRDMRGNRVRLFTGQWFFFWSVSRLLFFNRGSMTEHFAPSMVSSESDLFTRFVIKG